MNMNPAAPAYVPGACNIGSAEVATRRTAAVASTVATLALGTLVLAAGAPREARLLVGLPAAGTVVAWLQVRNRFCVAYATRGVFNVSERLGAASRVEDRAARAADRRRAARMIASAAAVGLATAVGLYLLP